MFGSKHYVLRFLTPPRIFVLSFAGFIMIGSLFLWLPFAATRDIPFIDALFMSTSAVCVTGLATLDIGTTFSRAGQIVLIVLFQLGGLGIITFSAFLFGIMRRGISFKGREIVQTTLLPKPRRDFFLILKVAVLYTLVIESAGAVLLFLRFSTDFPPGQALYFAVFHALSAFNNCGLSLFADSFIRYRGDVLLNVTIMSLIILGGIGFVVQYEILRRLKDGRSRISLHSRIVILTTAFLILGGAVFFWVFEGNHTLQGLPFQTKALVSLFQSVTTRTAGFSTVDIANLTNATIMIMMVLMFIGGSPGSTAGGIKTTSFALLILTIWNRWRGRETVSVGNRTIPDELISRTLIITLLSMSFILIAVAVIMTAGHLGSGAMERQKFVEYTFETISAFGTVGLSMGATERLNDLQKLTIILTMFTGRVGPLTLAFALSLREGKKSLIYAEETVMVG
ncbi:MAG TPA: TrkH family potassium uptake protein [Syntrophales bacterium]|nr:TrkH family potassium uptake protein [Syntrophales bacterium]